MSSYRFPQSRASRGNWCIKSIRTQRHPGSDETFMKSKMLSSGGMTWSCGRRLCQGCATCQQGKILTHRTGPHGQNPTQEKHSPSKLFVMDLIIVSTNMNWLLLTIVYHRCTRLTFSPMLSPQSPPKDHSSYLNHIYRGLVVPQNDLNWDPLSFPTFSRACNPTRRSQNLSTVFHPKQWLCQEKEEHGLNIT